MDDSLLGLHNKAMLVTGGASGIGLATVTLLAQQGAQVISCDLNTAAGEASIAIFERQHVEFMPCDVTQSESVARLFETIQKEYGRLDCLVNNAGVEGDIKRTADIDEETFDSLMAVNVKGVWLCMKHALKLMLAQEPRGGSIINMASVAGLVGAHSLPIYSSSKHAVVGLTRSSALEGV